MGGIGINFIPPSQLEIHLINRMQGQVTATLGLLNGMIGGTILVLPLIGLQTGYIYIPLVSILYGAVACYTCQLMIQHLGQSLNIRQVILEHFNNKHSATVVYNLVIGASLLGFIINYFILLIIQLEGLLNPSPWIPIAVLLILIALTLIMRTFHFGERLLAIGILSIVTYVGFLFWAQFTAPAGPKRVPATGPRFVDLAGALVMGYAIHDFVVQVLLNTTTHQYFKRVVNVVYVGGTIIYTFITFGAYAIVNREPHTDQPDTIEDYFARGGWQVSLIEVVYAFHLFTASPEFCIIMRQRFLQMCKQEDTPNLTIPEVAIYLLTYGLAYLMYTTGVKLATVIEINGSVIGFLYVFLIPVVLHIKCVYFTKHDENGVLVVEVENEEGQIVVVPGTCKCQLSNKSKLERGLQLGLQMGILVLGLATVAYSLYRLFGQEETEADLKPGGDL